MQNISNKSLNYFLLVLVAAFWGGSFVAIKYVIADFPPIFSAFLRVGTSLILLYLFFLFTRKNLAVSFPLRCRLWTIGIFAQGIPFSFLFWGEHLISAGLAGILNGTVPIWIFLISILFLRKTTEITTTKILGVIWGFMGIIVIFWPMLTFHEIRSEALGIGAVLIMAISYSIASLLTQHLFAKQKIDFYANLYHQQWGSVMFLFLLSILLEKWPSLPVFLTAYPALIATFYMGLCSTALAWLIYYHLIREWGAIRTSAVTYLMPIMALLWDYVFLHNLPTLFESVGVVIILTSVLLMQYPNTSKIKTLSQN
jgi:drug/metabolite transporter (DMT)-like permease